MAYIIIGRIINTHGIKGDVKILSSSDFDAERYQKGNTVYIHFENDYIPMEVCSYKVMKNNPIVRFKDHENINLIEKYKNCEVCVDKADRKPLPEGQYYRSDFEGLAVYDEENVLIGTVKGIEETAGAQNNIRVKREGKNDALIPNIPEFVKNVDLENKKLVIHVEEGLL